MRKLLLFSLVTLFLFQTIQVVASKGRAQASIVEEIEKMETVPPSIASGNILKNPNFLYGATSSNISDWRVVTSGNPVGTLLELNILGEAIPEKPGDWRRTNDPNFFMGFQNINSALYNMRSGNRPSTLIVAQEVETIPGRRYQVRVRYGIHVGATPDYNVTFETRIYDRTELSGTPGLIVSTPANPVVPGNFVPSQSEFTAVSQQSTISFRTMHASVNRAGTVAGLRNSALFEYGNDIRVTHVDLNGENLVNPETVQGFIGESFTTTSKLIKGYSLLETPANARGTFTRENQTVTYVYHRLPASIAVSPDISRIVVGESIQKKGVLTPDLSQLDDSSISWSSSNESIATVDGTGMVTGVSGGEVTITGETINGLRAIAEVTVEEFTFRFTDSVAYVTGYLGDKDEVVVPKEAADFEQNSTNPVPVIGIDNNAFQNSSFKNILFPDTILSIGDYAVANNSSLEVVTLSENLKTIGDSSFLNTGITNIEIPDSVLEIGNNAFEFSRLSRVSLGGNISSIGNNAFHKNNLTEINIPDSVLTIGNHAFFENQLTKITIGNGLRELSLGVFGENKLSNITIPEGITTIGSDAFRQNQLSNVEFPKSLNSIGDSAFRDNLLINLFFQGKVAEIGSQFIRNNPVIEISVPEEHVEDYKRILTNTRMSGVTNQASITVESHRYSGETLEVNDIVEGDSISFEVISRFRYKLADLSNYEWEIAPSITSIWWYKDGVARTVGTTFSIDSAQESDGGVYFARDISNRIDLDELFVTVSPLINPPIPPINPENPGPIEPENPNINTGALAIRHIHSLDFGKIKRENGTQEIKSKLPKDIHGEKIPEMVAVQDLRSDSQRNGWQLTVRQIDAFMDGAEIIKNPYVHEYYSNELGVKVNPKSLILNQEKQLFSWANEENKAGIVSFGYNDPSELGTTLRIPEGLGIGTYETTLEWVLIQGP